MIHTWNAWGNRQKFPDRYLVPVVLLLLCLPVFYGHCLATEAPEELPRPKIGLVLSGGGARGAAHIGVIKVLEEMRIPIDYIGGTSMGSIVGGLYASGMSIDELEKTVISIDWKDAFSDLIPREDRSFRRKTDDKTYLVKGKPGLSDSLEIKFPPGLIQGQKIDILFKRLALPVSTINDFDNFRIPFRAVATDIVTGEPVIIGSGDLAQVMRASMSVPSVFSPVIIDDKILVDGGVSKNLPIDVVRNMGADIIIAVDISTPLAGPEKLKSALEITKQLSGILTRRNTEEQIATLTEKDVFIVPDLADITSGSFSRADNAITIGYKAAKDKKPELTKLALSQSDFDAYLAARKPETAKSRPIPPVIHFIKLDNRSKVSDKMILARLHIETGQPLDVEKLEKDIGLIYGLELFENITYEIVEEDERTGLILHVRERSWGPNYIQAGLALASDQKGDNYYNFGFAYTRTAINKLDGELRVAVQVGSEPLIFAEIYQPFDYGSRYFIHPKLFWDKRNVNIFSTAGEILTEYRIGRYGGDLAVGRELGTWGETRVGIRRMQGDAKVRIGGTIWPDYDYDSGEVYLKLSADKLNNFNFPREGIYGFVEYLSSLEDIGADSSFNQVLFDALIAKSWDRNTLLGGARFYSTLDSDAPLQNLFQLGGLFNLSGYIVNELSGQHLGLLKMIYMRRIGNFNIMPTYIGASLESGNVWQDKDDIDFDTLITAGSLFLGVDTPLGPIYLGYGLAEGNRHSYYFYLGQLF
jgi:NTE family protein